MHSMEIEFGKLMKRMKNSTTKAIEYVKILDKINELEDRKELDDGMVAVRGLIAQLLSDVGKRTGKKAEEVAAEIVAKMKIIDAMHSEEDGGAEKNEKNEEDHIGTITLRIDVDSTGGSGK